MLLRLKKADIIYREDDIAIDAAIVAAGGRQRPPHIRYTFTPLLRHYDDAILMAATPRLCCCIFLLRAITMTTLIYDAFTHTPLSHTANTLRRHCHCRLRPLRCRHAISHDYAATILMPRDIHTLD